MAMVMCLCVVRAEAVEQTTTEPIEIAVVLDTPSGFAAEPEKVYTAVEESLRVIFPNKSLYKIQPISDNDAYVQMYREENDLAVANDSGQVTANGARSMMMKKTDMAKLNEHFKADYITYIRVTSSVPQITVGFWSAGQKVNVTTDFRVWSKKTGEYIYMKRAMTSGSSSSMYGVGHTGRAVDKGLRKAFAEIEKDSSNIRMKMMTE
jgi:hypothetical protein